MPSTQLSDGVFCLFVSHIHLPYKSNEMKFSVENSMYSKCFKHRVQIYRYSEYVRLVSVWMSPCLSRSRCGAYIFFGVCVFEYLCVSVSSYITVCTFSNEFRVWSIESKISIRTHRLLQTPFFLILNTCVCCRIFSNHANARSYFFCRCFLWPFFLLYVSRHLFHALFLLNSPVYCE